MQAWPKPKFDLAEPETNHSPAQPSPTWSMA